MPGAAAWGWAQALLRGLAELGNDGILLIITANRVVASIGHVRVLFEKFVGRLTYPSPCRGQSRQTASTTQWTSCPIHVPASTLQWTSCPIHCIPMLVCPLPVRRSNRE